ncbi:hypothetical protein V5O48_012549 [Marasmius crinis-equi]|uniref:Uncharacterized protein n=1 Tax=Marasmius crinis-equi TaxID=585013 RepID=A0ABR3F342_9AGAR
MPQKPSTHQPTSKWWDPLPPTAFLSEPDTDIRGLGRWKSQALTPYEIDIQHLLLRVGRYRTSQAADGEDTNRQISMLEGQLERHFRILSTQPLPYGEAQKLFAFVCRWYLELGAALDWVEVIQPVMDGVTPPTPSSSFIASNAMGAFLYNLSDCEFFFKAGIPFWFVRPEDQLVSARLDREVPLSTPASLGIPLDNHISDEIIFSGANTDPRKALAIERYGKKILDTKRNPFDVACGEQLKTHENLKAHSPSDTVSSRRSNRLKQTSTSRKAPYKKPSPTTERDKFGEVESPFTPDVPHVWVQALGSIDKSRRPPKADVTNGGYVFPDPGMVLFSPPEKMTRVLSAWLRLRDVLIFRVTMAPCLASGAWSPQQWRLLLAVSDSHPSKSGTYMAQQRQVVKDLLGECLTHYNLTHEPIQHSYFTWRNKRYPLKELANAAIAREIVYELFELNFRSEFDALDQKLRKPNSPTSHPTSASATVQSCFPGTATATSLLEIDWKQVHGGLATLDLTQRGAYIRKMCLAMKDWPGGLRGLELLQGSVQESELRKTEEWATRFYCQTFYENFGRPPIIPHSLSAANSSARYL